MTEEEQKTFDALRLPLEKDCPNCIYKGHQWTSPICKECMDDFRKGIPVSKWQWNGK